jgi:N12 class adenine-specific DNA methylase
LGNAPNRQQRRWCKCRRYHSGLDEQSPAGSKRSRPAEPKDLRHTYITNQEETAKARGKADEISSEFQEWLWKDQDRRENLKTIYNDTMNRTVKRTYDGSIYVDANGQARIPGLSHLLNLRPHILNVVFRAMQTGKVLVDHTVGSGKTPTGSVIAMEWRRLGQAKKPMLVVPNHLIEQWAAEFKKFFPNANVLAASRKDFEKQNRKQMFAKIATGDWDAVVVAHSSFGFIPVPREVEVDFIQQQIDEIAQAIQEQKNADQRAGRRSRSMGVKDMEKLRDRLKDKLKKLNAKPKDDLLNFAQMGVDGLIVDEFHKFKNLYFNTQKQGVAGLGNQAGSQRAFDMFMKSRMVMDRNNGRNFVALTGTPVSNSLAEIYHMQRYMQYDDLKARGLHIFDAWANMFANDVQDWEINAAGKFQPRTRFSKFGNLPELRKLWQSVVDTITRDDLMKAAEERGERFPIPHFEQIPVPCTAFACSG